MQLYHALTTFLIASMIGLSAGAQEVDDPEPQTLLHVTNIQEVLAEYARAPEKQIARHTDCIELIAFNVIDDTYDGEPDRQAIDLAQLIAALPTDDEGKCNSEVQCEFKAHFDTRRELEDGLISGQLKSETLSADDLSSLKVSETPKALQRAAFDIMGMDIAHGRLEYLKSVPDQKYEYYPEFGVCSAMVGIDFTR